MINYSIEALNEIKNIYCDGLRSLIQQTELKTMPSLVQQEDAQSCRIMTA